MTLFQSLSHKGLCLLGIFTALSVSTLSAGAHQDRDGAEKADRGTRWPTKEVDVTYTTGTVIGNLDPLSRTVPVSQTWEFPDTSGQHVSVVFKNNLPEVDTAHTYLRGGDQTNAVSANMLTFGDVSTAQVFPSDEFKPAGWKEWPYLYTSVSLLPDVVPPGGTAGGQIFGYINVGEADALLTAAQIPPNSSFSGGGKLGYLQGVAHMAVADFGNNAVQYFLPSRDPTTGFTGLRWVKTMTFKDCEMAKDGWVLVNHEPINWVGKVARDDAYEALVRPCGCEKDPCAPAKQSYFVSVFRKYSKQELAAAHGKLPTRLTQTAIRIYAENGKEKCGASRLKPIATHIIPGCAAGYGIEPIAGTKQFLVTYNKGTVDDMVQLPRTQHAVVFSCKTWKPQFTVNFHPATAADQVTEIWNLRISYAPFGVFFSSDGLTSSPDPLLVRRGAISQVEMMGAAEAFGVEL